ncbi:MAG: AMP-binding protein [Treponema sp.]|nr:AMP-binding protein [Treponema sp.]
MEILESTLGTILREKARELGDKEFIIYSNQNIRITYAEFDKKVDALAKSLLAMGLKKGDHIGLWANNIPEWAIVFFAAARAGVVLVTINPNYKAYEMEYVVRQADLKALFIVDKYRDSDYLEIIYQLIPELNTADVEGELFSRNFPSLKMVINISTGKQRGIFTYGEFLRLGSMFSDERLHEAEAQVTLDDTLAMMYTSGSTGQPKGVMLTFRGYLSNSWYSAQRLLMDENSVMCNPLPLFHVMSLFHGLVGVLMCGAKVANLEWFDPVMLMAVIQKEKCTVMLGVPTMYIAIMSHPLFNMFDFSSMKTGGMAGAFCPPEVIKQAIEKMHVTGLFAGYGLTECSTFVCVSSGDDPEDQRINTIGKPLPGIEITIRNVETNEECPGGTQGEICVRGNGLMKGYYKMEEATKKTIDEQGWLHTGDLGEKLDSGCFIITGRSKDIIIWGGENIYPKEVEDFIYSIPGVKDVQVVGITNQKYGEVVGAFISLKDGVTMTEKDVKDFCQGKITHYKIPRYVFFVDSFPLTSSGKIQKYKLREIGNQKVKEQTQTPQHE